MRHFIFILTLSVSAAMSADLPLIKDVELQPFAAQVKRLVEAADYLGSPFSAQDKIELLAAALEEKDSERLQRVLDRYCLCLVHINPEMRVKVGVGPAKAELDENGWRQFLVKVHNEAGATAQLKAVSPNAERLFNSPQEQVLNRWLDLQMFDAQPLAQKLSGLKLEYRIIQLYSRDAGKREAKLSFNVGQGTQDIGFRNDVDILFECQKAHDVKLRVRDEEGDATTASFVFRDKQGRVYPSQAKRLAPDFAFHPQVYRHDGEKIKLPQGEYTVEVTRGPEYLPQTQSLVVNEKSEKAEFKLQRWVDPAKLGWWSGDHHIHAAGCQHYTKPTEGVHAPDMYRHCLGEDLKVGINLTWGPCFDYQKQFFTGKVDKVSKSPYLLRYDVEISGFGSHQSGHLCLLRLKEQIYPGGESKDHWPSLCLNSLRWAKKQGAVCGPAHSGWGLEPAPATDELPNYTVPPYNGIGACEFIMNITHEVPGPDGKLVPAVDFMSLVDTPSVWELNMWYHSLNAGYRVRGSGETDFPCIYGQRVGIGRSYVKLDGKLDYDEFCEGIRQGRSYVGDGKSHLMEFKVNELGVGEKGSELKLDGPATVKLSAKVAARLNDKPDPELRKRLLKQQPYWDIERARVGESKEVPVEVIVNGYPVAKKMLVADGHTEDMSFDVKLERSSWVALRIFPSSHTNPVFVLVGGKPIRASKRSIDWCLKGVDQCWSQKERFIKPEEMEQAKKDYEHARVTYKRLLAECEVE